MSNHRNVRLTPKALGAKAATFEADKANRRTFIMVGGGGRCCSQILCVENHLVPVYVVSIYTDPLLSRNENENENDRLTTIT